jgi:excisionase family DNA binding protein
MMATEAHDLLTLRQVARLHRVSKMAVFKWVSAGRLPASRIGSQWVVRRRDAESFHRTRAGASGPPQ